MTLETGRRSELYENFNSRQKDSFKDPKFHKLNINKDRMLNYFLDH